MAGSILWKTGPGCASEREAEIKTSIPAKIGIRKYPKEFSKNNMNDSGFEIAIAIGLGIDFDFDLIEKWQAQYKMFILFLLNAFSDDNKSGRERFCLRLMARFHRFEGFWFSYRSAAVP